MYGRDALILLMLDQTVTNRITDCLSLPKTSSTHDYRGHCQGIVTLLNGRAVIGMEVLLKRQR